MWGRTVGDSNMEARGNLQLAITARSLQSYYLYTSDNTVQVIIEHSFDLTLY